MATLANGLLFEASFQCDVKDVRLGSVAFHLLFGDMLFSSTIQPQWPGCSACASFHKDYCEEETLTGASLLHLSFWWRLHDQRAHLNGVL